MTFQATMLAVVIALVGTPIMLLFAIWYHRMIMYFIKYYYKELSELDVTMFALAVTFVPFIVTTIACIRYIKVLLS